MFMGFYSITLPAGNYTIEYRYIGFVVQRRDLVLSANRRIDIELKEEEAQLAEVVVTAKPEDRNVTSTEMSVAELDIKNDH